MKKLIVSSLVALSMIFAMPVVAETKDENSDVVKMNYYIGTDSLVNAGLNDGYSKTDPITEKDYHYGWSLGKMCLSGYTRVKIDEDGTPIFLKNYGDKISFNYLLTQDINCLNDNKKLSIAPDSEGYDYYFGTKPSNLERGALFIRKTDYENNVHEPVNYTNFFVEKAEKDANKQIDLLEEGDYEVALDYKVRSDSFKVMDYSIYKKYSDYRESAKFKIRNGNCMVFPFDAKTGSELGNGAICEEGFKIDLVRSKYLNIDVKRETLNNSQTGLKEDVQFNRPAKDGELYTKDGIYTITASNQYTGQTTEKKIYVGSDNVMKAYVTTGQTIEQIKQLIDEGAIIKDDGSIVFPVKDEIIEEVEETPTEEITEEDEVDDVVEDDQAESEKKSHAGIIWTIIILVVLGGGYYAYTNQEKLGIDLKKSNKEKDEDQNDEENKE